MRAYHVFSSHHFSTPGISFGNHDMFLLVYNSFILPISGGTKTNWIVLVNFSFNHMEPGEHKNTGKQSISYYKSK